MNFVRAAPAPMPVRLDVFAGGNVRQTYRGGTFQGRVYVAPSP